MNEPLEKKVFLKSEIGFGIPEDRGRALIRLIRSFIDEASVLAEDLPVGIAVAAAGASLEGSAQTTMEEVEIETGFTGDGGPVAVSAAVGNTLGSYANMIEKVAAEAGEPMDSASMYSFASMIAATAAGIQKQSGGGADGTALLHEIGKALVRETEGTAPGAQAPANRAERRRQMRRK